MLQLLCRFLLVFCISSLLPQPVMAFTYEVLFENSIGRDAVRLGRQPCVRLEAKAVLLDGQIKTGGTDTTSYDRSVLSYAQFTQQVPLGPSAALRATLPLLVVYNQKEGGQVPRQISDSTWLETKPKIELTYASPNALDVVLGLDIYYVAAHKYETEAANFTATDDYQAAAMNFGHLAVVKHASNFDGGFSFKLGAEKLRSMSKTTSLEDTVYKVEDRIYDPTTVSIFMQSRLNFGQIYGEFSAVEASGGGNRTDLGATVKEDYFRVQLAALIPLGGNGTQLEPILIYKSLSYADSRNVSFDTMPMLGIHLKLQMNLGIPVFAGLIGVKGSDRQSIPEFNANHKIFGIGALAGSQLNF